jgi:cytochrome c5
MSKKFSRLLAIAGLISVLPTLALAMGGKPNNTDEEAVNARIQPVAKIKLAPASSANVAAAGSRSGEEIYKAVCAACHATGVAGAPKIGDKAAWAPRIGVGLDALVKSSKAGKNAMPPKGGSDATDEELARVVAFMANGSGANFK